MPYAPGDILLDKYRIEALLGQGAFGDVYRVTHLRLNVPRALKVLRRDTPGLGSTEFNHGLQRFQLEAQLGAKLNSPNPNPHLLQVHDIFNADDLLVLEMEFAPGGNLAERIQKSRDSGFSIPIEDALQIAMDVASGLGALHAIDIVHRDLKPANILFDQHGHARLADLGLAQIPGGPSKRSQLSEPSPHPGTPGYMSPEQRQFTDILTPPSDIFALGLVLFELFTSRNYTFLRPGTRVQTLRADVSTALDELLAKMLAKTPEERPWDGEETAGLLREALNNLHYEQAAEEQARLEAKQKAEVDAAEKVRLAIESERRTRDEFAEKTRREAEEQVRQTAQAKSRAEAAERALKAEKEARLASERKARENAYHAPASTPKTADSRFSFAGLAGLGFIGLAAALFVFVIVFIFGSTGRSTPASPAPTTTVAIAAVTDQPSPVPPVTAEPPAQSPTRAPTYTPVPALSAGSTQAREKDGMVMVYVPAGTFTMGSDSGDDDEKPAHSVTLDAFWIDQTEVTNGKYAQCVHSGGLYAAI